MEQQRKNNERLKELIITVSEERDKLQNKKNHAEIMAITLHNTMVDTTHEYSNTPIKPHSFPNSPISRYVEKKKQLALDIEEQKYRKRMITNKERDTDLILSQARQGLMKLNDACRLVNIPGVQRRDVKIAVGGIVTSATPPEIVETDGKNHKRCTAEESGCT